MKKKKLPYQQKSGFQVPSNYFEDLEATLLRKISKDSVDMNSYKGVPGFNIPDNYFTLLEEQVIQKVENTSAKEKVVSIFKRRSFYYAAAVAAIFVGLLWTNLFKPDTPENSIDTIEISAIEEYIDEGYMDLNFNEISAYITEEGNPSQNFNVSAISDEEVLNYLSENVEDPDLLIE